MEETIHDSCEPERVFGTNVKCLSALLLKVCTGLFGRAQRRPEVFTECWQRDVLHVYSVKRNQMTQLAGQVIPQKHDEQTNKQYIQKQQQQLMVCRWL